MGDEFEFFAGKAGPAVTSAAAAAAANAAASAERGANLQMMPPPMGAFDINDAHSPMKVPVPSDGRGKKGGGRGGGGRTPHRKAAPQPPPPPSFQQPDWDVSAGAFQQAAIPPAYGMTAAGMAAYPPAPAAGMPTPYPVPCPPMPMYGMTPGMMPFMYPPMVYPGMPNASPPMPPEKSKGKAGKVQNTQQGQQGKEGKKRRGKAKSGKEPSTPEANPNCSEELLAVRNAQSSGVKAKLSFQEAGCSRPAGMHQKSMRLFCPQFVRGKKMKEA